MGQHEPKMPQQILLIAEMESTSVIKTAAAITMIDNQPTADTTNVIITKINRGLKALDDKRLKLIKPFIKIIEETNDWFRKITTILENEKTRLTNLLMNYRHKQQEVEQTAIEEARKRDKKRAALQEYHKEIGHKTTELVPTPTSVSFTVTDTTKIRKNWTFRIVDESQIPDEYWVLDETKIHRAILNAPRDPETKQPLISIKGIEIYQKEIPIFG